ncbi:MAG: hypothetical protein QNK27_08490 [Desulfuromusa sp.]|nr:hypothetical protein [Desulfuromusa sp.]
MRVKNLFTMFSLVLIMTFTATSAFAKWNFGLGTGLTMLAVEGDIGINTILAGPVTLPVELDAEDVSDLMASAFGFGGYATDGTWMINYSFGMMELEGDAADGAITASLDYKTTGAELTVGYPIYKSSPVSFSLLGGLRYTKHELSTRVSNGITTLNNNKDNNWTDVVFGATADVELHKDWTWSTRADAGFGGSEGTYVANTGVTWRFLENWSGTLFAKYAAVEFENGSRGDSNWYFYDVDEKSLGLTILYHW